MKLFTLLKSYVANTGNFMNVLDKNSISDTMGEDFTASEELVKKMAETFEFSASETASAFTYMAVAGCNTDNMLNEMQGVLNQGELFFKMLSNVI